MTKLIKLTSVFVSITFALIFAGTEQAKAQWDRSYLQYYPQCDMTGNFTYYIQQQYLEAFGDPYTAQQAMLRDLYRQEIRCVESQQNSVQPSRSRTYQVPNYREQTQDYLRQSCESRPGRVWTGLSCVDMSY